MYEEVSKLIVYRMEDETSILYQMAMIYRDFTTQHYDRAALISRIYTQIKALLDLSTSYGFNHNLWQQYLTFVLMTTENSFTLVHEKSKLKEGSIEHFAKHDFQIFHDLFHYDFTPLEEALGIDCFTTITHYTAITKKERMYNKNVSLLSGELCERLATAQNGDDIFTLMSAFYEQVGVGMFGLNKAFRIQSYDNGTLRFLPINNMDQVVLSDLIGYDLQKQLLKENTEAFVNGGIANNVLLYGDSGTGKSTSIKAIVNEYYPQGLRMIEIYKHQFKDLSTIIAQIKNRNYRFIIYMDDLSFEEFEIEYKFLKAVIEGGVETKPDNILIYATSNRRHLVRETWKDRNDIADDDELHHSDTMQEKLSLVARFGLTICYERPNQKSYFDIVHELAKRYGIKMEEEQLDKEARAWGISHGGNSGRAAQQLINDLLAREKRAR